jgi:hypothetical protein
VYLNSVVQKLVPYCPRECSWSLGPVGTVEQVWDVFGWLKGCKLDLSSKGKIGEIHSFVHKSHERVRKVKWWYKSKSLAVCN